MIHTLALFLCCFLGFSFAQSFPNGIFRIASASNPNLVLDVTGASNTPSTGLIVFTLNGGANQEYRRGPSDTVQAVGSGLYLDIQGGAASGARLIQFTFNGNSNQKFFPVSVGRNSDQVTIQVGNRHSNLCLDISNNNINSRTPVIAFNCNNQINQRWIIQNVRG